jgi:hypothetical protein
MAAVELRLESFRSRSVRAHEIIEPYTLDSQFICDYTQNVIFADFMDLKPLWVLNPRM